jgi:hypothetical protein
MASPRLQRPAIFDALVAAPRPLQGFQPKQQVVGGGRPLPGLIRYGNQPPGLASASRFTGGTVPNPMSLAHGEETPGFTAPTYAPTGATAPTAAPSGAMHPSAVASALAPAPTGAIGGIGATPLPIGNPNFPGATRAPVTFAPGPGPARAPVSFVNAPPGPGAPPQGDASSGLAALIAALAGRGQKLGGGGSNYQRAI